MGATPAGARSVAPGLSTTLDRSTASDRSMPPGGLDDCSLSSAATSGKDVVGGLSVSSGGAVILVRTGRASGPRSTMFISAVSVG